MDSAVAVAVNKWGGLMEPIRRFFVESEFLDRLVLRQLSHVRANWELTVDINSSRFLEEDDSYAFEMNQLIDELVNVVPPSRYHDNEDRLAEFCRDKLQWNVQKVGGRWYGEEYACILEQGGFHDIDQSDLLLAAAGRIHSAISRRQMNFDEMEKFHRKMLADVLAIILYHRAT